MLLSFITFFLQISTLLMSPLPSYGIENNITVSMEIEEVEDNWFFMPFIFEDEYVQPVLKKKGVRLPDNLTPSDRLGITLDRVPLITRQDEDGMLLLTLDLNGNSDLTDDDAVSITANGSVKVRLLRTYASNDLKPAWLPYLVKFVRDEREGKVIDHFLLTTLYKAKGYFTFEDIEYYLSLNDMDCNGRFDHEDLSGGSALQVGLKGEPLMQKNIFYGFQLIPLGDSFFSISDLAEDGSYVQLSRNPMHPYTLGESTPDIPLTDIEGNTFMLNDFHGKVILLNFWDSG